MFTRTVSAALRRWLYLSPVSSRPSSIQKRQAPRPRPAGCLFGSFVAMLALTAPAFAAAPGAAASNTAPPLIVTVQGSQPTESGLELSVGIAVDGDGSTCGTETSVSVLRGAALDFCYTVTNHTATDLAYSTLEDSIEGNLFRYASTPIPVDGSYTFHHQRRAIASETHDVTWTARDVAPHYVADDTQPAAFVEINTTGTRLPLDYFGGVSVALPFRFDFYGVSSNRLCANNMGVVAFDVSGSDCNSWSHILPREFCVPPDHITSCQNGSFGALIAPFYTDLWFDTGGVYIQTIGTSPNRRFIIEWDRALGIGDMASDTFFETPQRARVEAILGEDGSIQFQYLTTDFGYTDPFYGFTFHHGNTAVVGLRNGQMRGLRALDGNFADPYSSPTVGWAPHTQLVDDPSSIIWTQAAATTYSASASISIDVGAPQVDAAPTAIAAVAPDRRTVQTVPLTIANTGTYELAWSIGAAPASHPSVRTLPPANMAAADANVAADFADDGSVKGAALSRPNASDYAQARGKSASRLVPILAPNGTECSIGTPGLLAHDDDVSNNGLAGGFGGVLTRVVDRFTPHSYPATIASVCVAFTTLDDSYSPQYKVVVYDDAGPGGSPGNLIGVVDATTTTTVWPALETFKDRVDISALNLVITSGSVYIGVQWDSYQFSPNYAIYLGFDDETDGTASLPLDPPEGGYYDSGTGTFVPNGVVRPEIRSWLIRAVEAAPGCVNPQDVPWLSISPTSGAIPSGGAADTALITLDPAGLDDGTYRATICIGANYGVGASVPVEFTVGVVDEIFANGFDGS